jgi:hypothetical protein
LALVRTTTGFTATSFFTTGACLQVLAGCYSGF